MSEREMKKWAKVGRDFIKNNPIYAAIGLEFLNKLKKGLVSVNGGSYGR
ncbi:MAG: hypothetical protein J6V90_08480 [Treponema sp.]|nr:hypothetical protein [Treponema sp.]